jgi:hypothetical protein
VGVELLTKRHAGQIAGVLGCWDRMLVFGTLPKICFAGGMTSFLYERKIRIFDCPKFAEPFRNRIHDNAEKMAAEAVEVDLQPAGQNLFCPVFLSEVPLADELDFQRNRRAPAPAL